MRIRYKIYICFFVLFLSETKAQKTEPNQELTKKNIFSRSKELTYENKHQYTSSFYNGIKQKSIDNFEEAINHFEKCIKIDKSIAAPFYEISHMYFYQEKYVKSVEYSKKAAELDPENKWYLEFYAENLFHNLQFSQSAKVYKKLIKKDKGNQNYYINLARAYIYEDNLKAAIKTYNDLEKVKGIHHFTSIQKHKIYIELKEFNSAAKELEFLIEKFPYDIEVYQMLSDCYILNNNFTKAFEVLKTLSVIDPNSASVHFTLSDFYLQEGDTAMYLEELFKAFSSNQLDSKYKINKFLPILQSLESGGTHEFNYALMLAKKLAEVHPENETINYIYADLLSSNNDLELALHHYKKVVKINKNQQEAWVDMMLLELEMKNYQDLIFDAKQSLEFFPTNPMIYYLKSLAYYNIKEYLKAINDLEIGVNFVVENQHLSSEMYSLLGNLYNQLSDYENSDKSYEKALEFLPNNVIALNNYAYYLALRGENLKKAEQMSKKTIELFPEEGNYYDTYAWILYKMKNFFEAKTYIKIAIEKGEDSNPVIMDHMSDILLELGETEESQKYKNKAEEMRGEIKTKTNNDDEK